MKPTAAVQARIRLLYHFCRLQLPSLRLGEAACVQHCQRAFALVQAKCPTTDWPTFLRNLHPLDWYLASACLEGDPRAWEVLFGASTGRPDCLLVDALRQRAARLYPRDEERQELAVADFWGHLLVADSPGSVPVLARYDGQRPLVPWLIRVFHNRNISQLRQESGVHALPEDDGLLPADELEDDQWHEAFRHAAREWLDELGDTERLILGLRIRYRLSQREVARLLGVHEGTVSRQTAQLRDRCLEQISRRLREQGWLGDDLSDLVRQEMASVLLDEPRLAADQLAGLLAARGRTMPALDPVPEDYGLPIV
ncbi:MAG: sigma-70 family RNA polymerase sigma factor [Gemmataceae bacterium]|nr:sigma-70 family RNA polymerase sigma factor [Gemmataceae bacterium]MDW8265419.1 sigma-70 family RNA polymerase sigma factor [Gemmataceae bacterium]